MMLGALATVAAAGAAATLWNRVVGGILLAAVVNAAATIGRLAFESTVQSGAPDANRGRAFSRFETQNQMAWVLGGVVPVVASPSGRIGFALAGLLGAVGALLFHRHGAVPPAARLSPRNRGGRARDRARRSR